MSLREIKFESYIQRLRKKLFEEHFKEIKRIKTHILRERKLKRILNGKL